jgi:photosystem II stability/assembly factor-like uncharacterized protein
MIGRNLKLATVLLLFGQGLTGQNPFEAYKGLKEMEDNSVFGELPWEQIGPAFQGGRVETIDCPAGQPNVIYAGFGSGSLWKSIDQGLSWKCIFTDQATFSIGDVAVSPSHPETIYLGTGENLRATRGYTYPGTGMYKSVNGGQSWTSIGLHDSHHIGRVVIDPNDPNLVFVAAMGHMWSKNSERGLFMTRDGGKSWKKSLFISDSTGVVDVAWDPAGKIIYAAAWEMIQGKGSGIYKSSDFGDHWEKCLNGFPENSGIGRIGLAISSTQPQTVYACLDNRNNRPGKGSSEMIGLEIYRSEDSGKSWSKMNSGYLDNYSGFGWAFGDIRVSPFYSREIYVLGVHALYSDNGGRTTTRLGGAINHLLPSPAKTLHLDHHDLYIDPSNPDRLILGNDGGIYMSPDKGQNWLHSNTIPVAEMYDLKIDPMDQARAYAGTQDNSGIYGPLNLEPTTGNQESWTYVWLDPWSGGDGFVTIPDPTDPSSVYYESQNGYLNRKNLVTGETEFIQPKTEEGESPLRTSWLTPYFVSAHSPTTLYYGANKIYKSIDRGDSWYRVSRDLCFPANPERNSRAITALAESPLKPGLLYAGTEKGAMWVSRDDGINWIEISEGLPVKSVVAVCSSRHKESRVYAVLKSIEEDDYRPYLFISENNGSSWKPISNSLPEDRINCILEDPDLKDLIYAGTDRGVLISPDTGTSWTSISKKLTTASIQALAWAGDNRYLVAATHGQSLFSCFAVPLRKYFKSVDPESECLLAVKGGFLPGRKDFSGDWDWSRSKPASIYWYQPVDGLMSISVKDSKEKEVFTGRIKAASGINVWNWDMVLGRKEDSGLYPVPEYKFPAPGIYQINIQGQGIVLRSDLEVR